MKHRNKNNRLSAFTLLELLVAMALMNMIALSLYSSLYITSKAKRSASDALRPYQAISAVFGPIRRDLQAAMPPTGILAGGFYGQNLSAGKDQDSDIIQFCCASYAPKEDEQSSNIVKVSYELGVDQQRQESILLRKVTVNLLSSKVAETPRQEVIGRRIRSFNIRYYDGYSWLDTWDSTTMEDQLPVAVEITLTADTTQDADRQQQVDRSEPIQKEFICRRVYLVSCAQPPTI